MTLTLSAIREVPRIRNRDQLPTDPVWLALFNKGRAKVRDDAARECIAVLASNADHVVPLILFGMEAEARMHEAWAEKLTAENDNG